MTYSLTGYGKLLADSVRMNGYTEALRQSVKPDSLVLDLGTGTGFFALLACKFGARKVYAVEPDEIIQVAREIAAANGVDARIEFVQALSTEITIPERADVIVSDLRDVLPFFRRHIASIADGRQRLLATGGLLIPRWDTLWAAVVEAADLYRSQLAPWNEPISGFEMRPARIRAVNRWYKARFAPSQLLVEPLCWGKLDYAIVDRPDVSYELTWSVGRNGIAHGLAVWFDTELAEGIRFSNAPGQPEVIYGNAFFPWSTPVTVATGDIIYVALRANLVGGDYVWCWNSCVLDRGVQGKVKAAFKQSTFLGDPLSPSRLRKSAAKHIPVPNDIAELDKFILLAMDGVASLDDIARKILERFPARFSNWYEALNHVSSLSEKYSR